MAPIAPLILSTTGCYDHRRCRRWIDLVDSRRSGHHSENPRLYLIRFNGLSHGPKVLCEWWEHGLCIAYLIYSQYYFIIEHSWVLWSHLWFSHVDEERLKTRKIGRKKYHHPNHQDAQITTSLWKSRS